MAAGKTSKSILISCGARLAPFDIQELREITAYDELELDTLGDKKTALFLIMSDTDATFNFLISMIYTQLFNLLCEKADVEYKALLAMVTEINATEVDKQDKLTDQVYHYDVTDKVFEKASRYEDRKQEKDKSHEKKSVLEKLEEKKDEAKATIGAKKTSYRDAVSL